MKYITLSIAVLLLSHLTNAQTTTKKHEVAIGYGFGAHSRAVYGNNNAPLLLEHHKEKYEGSRVDSATVADVMKTSNVIAIGQVKYSQRFSLGYKYKFNRWLAAGLTVSTARQDAPVVDKFTKATLGDFTRRAWTIAPEVNITYHAAKWIRVYGTYGLGMTTATEELTSDATGSKEKRSDTFVNFDLSPLGIKAGKRLCGFVEVGWGYKGVVHGGVAYAF